MKKFRNPLRPLRKLRPLRNVPDVPKSSCTRWAFAIFLTPSLFFFGMLIGDILKIIFTNLRLLVSG